MRDDSPIAHGRLSLTAVAFVTMDVSEEDPTTLGHSSKPCFVVPDGFCWDLSLFSIPEHYAPDLASVMIPHGLVMDRINKIAVDLLHAYKFREAGTRVHMLCVLKGGHQFFSDLCNALKLLTLTGCGEAPLTFDFIRVKSYTGTESNGAEGTKIETIGIDLKKIAGRHILLCEDIIDTGNTMANLVPYLKTFGPKTVRVATLLQKRTPKSNGFAPDYVGFSIPDEFVVGYVRARPRSSPPPPPLLFTCRAFFHIWPWPRRLSTHTHTYSARDALPEHIPS